jgi:hypothetical protein
VKRREFIGATAAAPLAAVPFVGTEKTKNPNNVPVVQFGEPKEFFFAGCVRKLAPVLNAEEIFANADGWDSHGFKFAHAWVNQEDSVYNNGPPGYPIRVIWGELRLTLNKSGAIYFDAVEMTGGGIEEARSQKVEQAFCYYPDPNGNNLRTQTFFDQTYLQTRYDDSGLPILKIAEVNGHFRIENAKEIFDKVEWKVYGMQQRKHAHVILLSRDAMYGTSDLFWGEVIIWLFEDGSMGVYPTKQSVRTKIPRGFYDKELKYEPT